MSSQYTALHLDRYRYAAGLSYRTSIFTMVIYNEWQFYKSWDIHSINLVFIYFQEFIDEDFRQVNVMRNLHWLWLMWTPVENKLLGLDLLGEKYTIIMSNTIRLSWSSAHLKCFEWRKVPSNGSKAHRKIRYRFLWSKVKAIPSIGKLQKI